MSKPDNRSFSPALAPNVDESMFEPVPSRRFEIVHERQYIEQIAERGGIHSCWPTSVLNGLISVDALITQEAQRVQDRLLTNRERWFRAVTLGGEDMKTFGGNTFDLEDVVEEVTKNRVRLQWMPMRHLRDVSEYVSEMLRYNAVVGGNEAHAILGAAIDNARQIVAIIDPRIPHVQDWSLERYVTFITSGSPELTVVQPPRFPR